MQARTTDRQKKYYNWNTKIAKILVCLLELKNSKCNKCVGNYANISSRLKRRNKTQKKETR